MIKEDYVSFEVAKLLEEKDFNEPCYTCYLNKELSHYDYLSTNFELIDNAFSAPTLQMACKWLREKHKIFIRIVEDVLGKVFELQIYQHGDCKLHNRVRDSYEEACEAAIKYCLENLI